MQSNDATTRCLKVRGWMGKYNPAVSIAESHVQRDLPRLRPERGEGVAPTRRPRGGAKGARGRCLGAGSRMGRWPVWLGLLGWMALGPGERSILASEWPVGTVSEDAGVLEVAPWNSWVRVSRDERFAPVPPQSTAAPLPHTTFETLNHGGAFGFAVGGVGDLNGDGWADIAIAAPRYGRGLLPDAGRLYLFHGSPSGPHATNVTILDGASPAIQFGRALAPGFDFNRDGIPDLL